MSDTLDGQIFSENMKIFFQTRLNPRTHPRIGQRTIEVNYG